MLMTFLQAGPIFAQANRQPQAGGPDAGMMAGLFICYGVVIVLAIAVNIMFLLNLSRCLAQCSPRNRTMEPGQVWLNLIPLFGIVWMFITIIRITESLQKEYRSRGLRPEDPEFAKMTGIIYMVLSLIGCGGINLIFFIMYWLKISAFKNELINNKKGGGIEDDYDDQPRRGRGQRDAVDDDDEEDDRPRRPRRPRDDDDD